MKLLTIFRKIFLSAFLLFLFSYIVLIVRIYMDTGCGPIDNCVIKLQDYLWNRAVFIYVLIGLVLFTIFYLPYLLLFCFFRKNNLIRFKWEIIGIITFSIIAYITLFTKFGSIYFG